MADTIYLDDRATAPRLTVLVTTDQKEGAPETIETYRSHLDALEKAYEFIVIVNAAHSGQMAGLRRLSQGWPELTVLGQQPWVGEDAALAMGLRRSHAELVLLMPGWPQVDPADLPALFDGLKDNDMVSAVRTTDPKRGWQGWRKGLFARFLMRLFGSAPSDPFCRTRLVRRGVLEDSANFGVRQHFLPVIAAQRGYRLTEAFMKPASSAAQSDAQYVFKPIGHVRALFDALALFVVLKFLRRPLRFFGAIGLPIFLIGGILTTTLVISRLFGDTALADRPALIFSVMMVVLGIQIIAIGLVGEIIVFSGARALKQYDVAEIITTGHRATGTERTDNSAATGRRKATVAVRTSEVPRQKT